MVGIPSFGARRLAAASLAVVLDVALERAGRRELAELVPHHRLRHEDGNVLPAVVNGEGVTQEVRGDDATARPRLDDVLGPGRVLNVHLLLEVAVNEGALLQTAWHVRGSLALVLAGATTAHDELVGFLLLVAGAALGLAPRAHRVTSTGRLALAATVRVVDRVHDDTADGRALALPAHAAGLAPVDVRLLGVADLADGRAASRVDVADFPGRHAQLGHRPVLGDQLDGRAGGAGDLGAASR